MLLETSWEVCNKMGGIYTVLASRAATMTRRHPQDIIFVGPLLAAEGDALPLDFIPTAVPELAAWQREASAELGLRLVVGRWAVAGEPAVVLVDFKPLWQEQGELYYEAWKEYGIEGDKGYGDYDESCLFAVAAARVMQSILGYYQPKQQIALFNEWQTGLGLLWLHLHAPEVKTIFITHATTVGRSIAGNYKELYTYMDAYQGDQMARELGVEAKHTLEKRAAHTADVFATVSRLTAREAKQLLEREPVVLPNGFHVGASPLSSSLAAKRRKARRLLGAVASKLYGTPIDERAYFISLGGRYEYRNKGIDLFIESLYRFAQHYEGEREIVACLLVPAWEAGPRAELQYLLSHPDEPAQQPLQHPELTHWLYNTDHDRAVAHIRHRGLDRAEGKVKLLFVPCYLNGIDGIFDLSYYDLLVGMDLTIYPSYYEPWGYTPLESIRYGVPTITTTLAGFGLWAEEEQQTKPFAELKHQPVHIVPRDDRNVDEAIGRIAELIGEQLALTPDEAKAQRRSAYELAKRADWELFYRHYEDAYRLLG
nr:glycogen/starch synthase [uncultured Porphyromonas sp.]